MPNFIMGGCIHCAGSSGNEEPDADVSLNIYHTKPILILIERRKLNIKELWKAEKHAGEVYEYYVLA